MANTKDNSKMGNSMDMEHSPGITGISMLETGSMIKNKAKEYITIAIKINTKGTSKMMNKMDMEHSHGITETNMKAIG